MMYLQRRWFASNNIGFSDGLVKPILFPSGTQFTFTYWRIFMSNTQKLIAVVGATGQQGGAVVRALQANGQFKVRALTRNPAKHPQLADEVVQADLRRPETRKAPFAGAHGDFLATNFGEAGAHDSNPPIAAVRAAHADA